MAPVTSNEIREVRATLKQAMLVLDRLEREKGNDPDQVVADAAIANLTDAGRELMHYVVGQGGKVDYNMTIEDLRLETRQLGGILSGITKRALPGEPPVIRIQDSDAGWDLVVEPRFYETALLTEIGV